MRSFPTKMAPVWLMTTALLMYGCGGGGGSSDDEMPTNGGDMAEMCPEGQTGTPPNCMVPGPTAEEIAATTKAAGTKRVAIKAEFDQADDAGLGGDDGEAPTSDQVEGEYNLNVKYGEVSIVKEAAAEANNEKFTQKMDLGGGTTMHVLAMDADDDGNVVEEVVIVSTDIEAPKATAFAMVRNAAGDLTQSLTVRKDGETVSADDPADSLSLTALDATDSAQAATLALVMASEFTSNTVATLTFGGDDPGDDDDAAAEVEGTYNGAMGTYTCAGGATDCTVGLDAMGKITAMSAGWIFTPDSGASSDVPDYDFLHYGFWLKKTTDEDGVLTYNEVETFAGSSIAATGSTASITGDATYSGGATGVYVHSVTNPDGTEASATSGHFTATAVLTAYFAQTTDDPATPANEAGQIPPGMLNSISGTINDFMLSGHDQGPGWSVSLERSDITTTTGTETGVAKGGGDEGSYTAVYHGGGGADNDQPTSVVGEFNAFFSNGAVAGAFGATKNKE